MADLSYDSTKGYELIEEKIGNLTRDIDTMINRNEISPEAATWLLSEFKNMVNTCREFYSMGEEKDNSHPLSF